MTRREAVKSFAEDMMIDINQEAIDLALEIEIGGEAEDFYLGAIWGMAFFVSEFEDRIPKDLRENYITFHVALCVHYLKAFPKDL